MVSLDSRYEIWWRPLTFSESLQHLMMNTLAYISSIFNQWLSVKVVLVHTQSSTLRNSSRNGIAWILHEKQIHALINSFAPTVSYRISTVVCPTHYKVEWFIYLFFIYFIFIFWEGGEGGSDYFFPIFSFLIIVSCNLWITTL